MGKDQELIDACRKGNLAAAEKLLSAKLAAKGKGPKATGTSSGGVTSLFKSISSLKGANVNCVDHSGDTPLHLAALNGFLDIVLLLLDCEANPTILDTQDCSPLHLAAWGGHSEICSHLLLSTEGQALLNLQTRDGNTALHFAAHHGYINVLSLLLQKGGDPIIRNLEDKSPLDLAAQYDRMDIVTQLITSHPELLAQRSAQNTPLHLASRLGHRAVVRYLLDSGFPIDAKTDKGTALHEAANFCKLDVIRLLLERGIDISVKSQTGCTAEDILRSIPSRAAEEALNILKTHIYHQRTPDSDGEKSIVGDTAPDTIAADSQRTVTQSDAQSVFKSAEHTSNLYKSLPSSNESSTAPPAIPPRLSFRFPEKGDTPSHPGLAPLSVPFNSETNSLLPADSPGDDDKSRPNISPSSKSPSELPKKPPRRKPLSFRRNDPDADPTVNGIQSSASGGKNYVNLDPEVERALVEKKLENISKAAQNEEGFAPTTSAGTSFTNPELQASIESTGEEVDNNDKPRNSRESKSERESSELDRDTGINKENQPIGPGDGNSSSRSVTITREERETEVTEVSSSPPTSLDIAPSPRTSAANPCVSTPTPTPRHQPPTPDCPPPSPSTALLNIQRQILPGENRRSKDMETITDSSLTEKEEQPTASQQQQQHQQSVSTSEVVTATTLPRSATKKKPTPLPRKSSLTSDTKDLPRTRTASSSIVTTEALTAKEGYSGGRPASAIVPTRVAGDPGDPKASPQQSRETKQGLDSGPPEPSTQKPPSDVSSSEGVELRSGSAAASKDLGMAEGSLEDFDDEPVQMRRSASAEINPGGWDNNVFAGLLRGSVVGTPRAVSHQFGDSNATAAALRSRKRKSTRSAFAPVMEEDKDLDAEKLFNDIDKINLDNRKDGTNKEEDDSVFDDFSDDWDQIAETISSYGGRISSSGDYAFFEAQIDHLLSGKGEDKIQSVGSWLADISLGQYENTLVANGFDDTDFLGGSILEDSDLEHIGVTSSDDRQAILEAARKLPAVQTIDPDNLPATVAEWLGSLRLDYYFDTFMSHKFDSMNRVIQLWELELVTVLDITSVGHRKRILASLGERRPDPNISPARIRVPSFGEPTKSPFDHVDLYRDYTGARSRVNDSGSDRNVGQGSLLEYDSSSNGSVGEGRGIRDEALHLRAPHLMHDTGAVKQWRHKPEILIKGCCNYTAHYLGSTLVKELKGAMSTQEGIAKLKKSSAVISKIPTIMLSISFKGVKFIDAVSKKVVCDHEIANIFCACQDGEHMNFFAYITKDKQAGMHYCHVFSVRSRELAGEIILTLGEAFEIAYQMALKEKAESEAEKFDKLCASDGDDANSVSSKASSNAT